MSWWSKLFKKRPTVICAKCIGYPWKDMNIPPNLLENQRLRGYLCQEIKPVRTMDFVTGEITSVRVACAVANANGHCPYYVRASPE